MYSYITRLFLIHEIKRSLILLTEKVITKGYQILDILYFVKIHNS